MENSNHVALITGASSGIGFELAKLFANKDYNIILVSDNKDKLETAASKIRTENNNAQIETIESDLSQEGAGKKLYADVQNLGINVNVLINNAGVGVYGDFVATSLKEELDMIRLNVISVVELTKLFVSDMIRSGGGKVLITSSVAALSGTPLLTVYGATKAFDFNFAMGLREELKDKNVTVTALLPSETDTNFFKRAGMENSKIFDNDMADPATVAKAGFDALMDNEAYVASPAKAKIIDIISHILPEDTKARMSKKQQEPEHRRAS